MLFVTDKEIAGAITEAVAKAASLKMAVAFWGKGAPDLLGLDAFDGRARIVCDAYSGACNPDVLALLIDRHDVRTLTGMHAKVYWTPERAIVGSANASVNGLRSEAGALRYEAATVTSDPATLSEIEAWFDGIFGKADPLNEGSVAEIRRRWEEAQARRPSIAVSSASLLRALAEEPEDFANRRIFVIVLNQGNPSVVAREVFDSVKAGLFRPEQVRELDESGVQPFYEDWEGSGWDVRANDIFLDFNRGRRGAMTYQGLWQVRNNAWRHNAEDGTSIVIADLIEQVDGRTLQSAESKRLGDVLKELIRADKADYDTVGFCRPLYEIRSYV